MARAPSDYNQPRERCAGMLGCRPTAAVKITRTTGWKKTTTSPSLDFDRGALLNRL